MADASTQPGFGGRLYQGWLLIAAYFGEVQTLVLLFLIYAGLFGPMGSAARLFRQDLLGKRGVGESGTAWNEADTVTTPDLERAGRMF